MVLDHRDHEGAYKSQALEPTDSSGPYIAGGAGGAVAPASKTNFFSKIVFD